MGLQESKGRGSGRRLAETMDSEEEDGMNGTASSGAEQEGWSPRTKYGGVLDGGTEVGPRAEIDSRHNSIGKGRLGCGMESDQYVDEECLAIRASGSEVSAQRHASRGLTRYIESGLEADSTLRGILLLVLIMYYMYMYMY